MQTNRRSFFASLAASCAGLFAFIRNPSRDTAAGEANRAVAASHRRPRTVDPAAGDCPVDFRIFGPAKYLVMNVVHRSKRHSQGIVYTHESNYSQALTAAQAKELVDIIEAFYGNWSRGSSGYPRDVWGYPQGHSVRIATVDGSQYVRLLLRYCHIKKT